MATVSTPVAAWVATLLALTGTSQSSNIYVSVSITGGWEIQIPVQVRMSAVSADPVVSILASMDGGANYDTTPLTSFSISRISGGGTVQGSVRLSTGQYLLQMTSSGPNSQSIAVLTQLVITAISNV